MINSINLLIEELARALPHIVGAVLIMLAGYFVAKILQSVTRRTLRRAGLDRFVRDSAAGNVVSRVTKSPSWTAGRLVYWVVMLGVIALAVSVLGIPGLTAVVAAIYAYLPNVLAAALILLVALAVSAGISGLVARLMGDTASGKLVASITPGLIFSVAIFMALEQLQIAPAIVIITYAAILGSVALGAALAFGLGGREVAAGLLQQAQMKAREQAPRARADMAVGAQRGREMAQEAKRKGAEEPGPAAAQPGYEPAPQFGESVESFQKSGRRRRDARHDTAVDNVIPPGEDG